MYQVEYAMEAISQAAAAVGIVAEDGVVLAAEKRILSPLLDKRAATEKIFMIDDHCAVAIAGMTSDANTLLTYARTEAQQYTYTYQEPIPLEQLLNRVCDLKQLYTQYGGLRPFGVSFLVAGWDEFYGFQLYQSDPSGNYGGWKARAIGANNQAAQAILKTDYKKHSRTVDDALVLAVQVLSKCMDTTSPSPDKLEFVTVTKEADSDRVVYKVLRKDEMEALIKRVAAIAEAEKQQKLKESKEGKSSSSAAAGPSAGDI